VRVVVEILVELRVYNSSVLVFLTLRAFISTILIWSSRGIGHYSSRGSRIGGVTIRRGGGGIIRGNREV